MPTAEERRRLVEGYIAAFNARDFDAVTSIYAEDATLEDPVGTEIQRGKPAIRAFYEQYREQPSFLQLTGDIRYAGNALAFSFFCSMGAGTDPMIVQITDTFLLDDAGRVKEMRAFWGEANVHGLGNRPAGVDQLVLAGRVALVVGDSPGAHACALELARRGASVAVAGQGAPAAVAAIVAAGGQAFALPASPSDGAALATLPKAVTDRLGRLDGCISELAKDAGHELQAAVGGARFVRIGHGDHGDHREDGDGAIRLVPGAATTPEDIADAAAWLMSPASRGLAAQEIILR